MVKDLVCGMEVDKKTVKHKTTYQGETYYFCAPGCTIAFEKDPTKYINDDSKKSNNSCCCGHC